MQANGVLALVFFSLASQAADSVVKCINYEQNRQPLFGDLHIHTKYSAVSTNNHPFSTLRKVS